MTRVCFDDGLSYMTFKFLMLLELLNITLVVYGFLANNTPIFWLGVLLNIIEFIIYFSWSMKGSIK